MSSPDSSPPYDSIFSPEEFGEAGGCGAYRCETDGAPAGGGALHLQTTVLENYGTISARCVCESFQYYEEVYFSEYHS